MRTATLKDIANMTGLSITTISKVVNQNDESVASEETIKRINDAIKQLGYVKSTRTKPFQNVSLKVGIVLCSNIADKFKHPYFVNIYRGLESELHKENCLIDFYYSASEINNSSVILQEIMSSESTALILIDEKKMIPLEFKKSKFQYILNINTANYSEWNMGNDVACVDSYATVRSVLNEFVRQGRKKILFVSGDGVIPQYLECKNSVEVDLLALDSRTLAYKDELLSNGISVDNKRIVYAERWDPLEAYINIIALLEEGVEFDAVYAADDDLALACLKALKEKQIEIPGQVALVGFNDLPSSSFSSPAISTIHVPCKELGQMAVQLLLLRIAGKLTLPVRLSLPNTIIKRETWY